MRAWRHVTGDLAAVAGPLLRSAIERTQAAIGRCRLAVAGGDTPGPVFAWLRAQLPEAAYRGLQVTFVDERMIPCRASADWRDTDWPEESNMHLAVTHWLAHAPQSIDVLPMLCTGEPATDLELFRAEFAERFQSAIDITLLGAGPDGHIGSIFPGRAALEERSETCVAVFDSPKPPPQRLTLTLPVLEDTECTVLVVRGAHKAEMLERAWDRDRSLPLGRFAPRGEVHWVLDPDAAMRLGGGSEG